MDKKIINKIHCAVDASLQSAIALPTIENCNFVYLKSNETFVKPPEIYAILILDKKNYQLYTESRFRAENQFDAIAYYDTSTNSEQDIKEICEVLDEILENPGVLPYQQIKSLMVLGLLIFDGNVGRIRGGSYDLHIDERYLKSGIAIENNSTIEINPLDFIVAGAKESVNLPKNICGNFDLKVSMFCRGIILSNGPQIDPGYQGRLFCLLFNVSANGCIIEQNKGYEFATIQFHALSKSTILPYKGHYLRKKVIDDYVGKYAKDSLAVRIEKIQDALGDIATCKDQCASFTEAKNAMQDNMTNINKDMHPLKGINDRMHNVQIELSNLQGRSQKWYQNMGVVIPLFLALIIAIAAALLTLSQQRELGAIQKQLEDPKLSTSQQDRVNSLIKEAVAQSILTIHKKP